MTMREAILEKLKRNHVSFAELRDIEGFEGRYQICSSDNYNIVYWQGVSPEAARTLNEMRDEGLFDYKPTIALTYLIDGAMPTMPQVKSGRKYKTPHWLPVVLVKP